MAETTSPDTTKKTSRPELPPETPVTLGLLMEVLEDYTEGLHEWLEGMEGSVVAELRQAVSRKFSAAGDSGQLAQLSDRLLTVEKALAGHPAGLCRENGCQLCARQIKQVKTSLLRRLEDLRPGTLTTLGSELVNRL